MAIRGVIFDMDGTITQPYLEFAKIKAEAGIGDVDMLDYLRSATGAEYERVHKILMRFEEDGAANAQLNPGARTLLDYLKAHDIPTGLLTRNSRKSVEIICRLLGIEFDVTVSRDEGPHKPSPEPIWQIMKRWGLQREEVVMVGDYKWDVLCANNAGVAAALLLYGDEKFDWAKDARYHLRQLTDLIGIIQDKPMSKPVIGYVTCSSKAEARQLASAVLNAKLAACVNILGGVESHYWWQGKLDQSKECLLMIKTTSAKTKALMPIIKSHHSYEVPEIIFTPIVAGERRYLKWLRGCVAVGLLGLASVACRADGFDDLVKQLGSTNDETRADAAAKIAQIGGPRAEKKFCEMAGSTSPERRQMAVVGLLQVSDEPADLELVRGRLKDENSTVRWSAALALGESSRSEAIPWLAEIVKTDANDEVREAATQGIAKLQSSIHWLRTLPEALKQAKESKRPVLAYFYLRGSDLCEQYEEGVLSDSNVVSATRRLVCVRLEVGKDGDQARKLDVRGAPTILILDGQGNEISRVPGLLAKEKLAAKLAAAGQGALSLREARRLAEQNPADVPANWKVAESYLEDGREDLAGTYLRNVIAADDANKYGHTDDAIFDLGFGFGKRGQYAQAVYCMEQLLKRSPQFKDRDKALYCLGLSQLAVGQKDQGRATLKRLIADFPGSGAVSAAKNALEKLGEK